MSKGINTVFLLGNLGSNPETRTQADGKLVTSFRLATSEVWKDKETNEKKERTEWHRVVVRGRLAEVARDFLKKGSRVHISGSIHTRKYESDGVEKYITEIHADDLTMLDPAGGSATE